ncbi:hypothetical protein [Aureimonas mangrovi]|uniref:hypothetical protein n=1 Tax=Aureimonas mangrovi TaxID=2758041 RepID=UPI00163D476A|nr:hypothetical protein [Aureimonas mangrovi]
MQRLTLISAVMTMVLAQPLQAQTDAPDLSPEPAPAGTSEEAGRLRDAIAQVTTQAAFENGLLRVQPAAAGYRVTFDPTDLLSDALGMELGFAPLSILVSAREDGDWNVFFDDPIEFSYSMEEDGVREEEFYRQDDNRMKGVWSPSLATFLIAEAVAGRAVSRSKYDFQEASTIVDETVTSMETRPGAAGGADIEFRQVSRGYSQSMAMEMPGSPGVPPVSLDFEAVAESIEADGAMSGVQSKALLDLLAFAFANIDVLENGTDAPLDEERSHELVERLRAAMPLWTLVDGGALARGMAVSSSYGNLSIEEAAQTIRMTGITEEALVEMNVVLSGMSVSSPMIPQWSQSLLPNFVEIGLSMTGGDLARPMEITLDELDFSAEQPLSDAAQERIAASFELDRIDVRLTPSRIRAQELDIAFSGDIPFHGNPRDASIAVDASGLDEAIATLQADANADMNALSAVGMMQIAKGMARTRDDGRLEWLVDVGADGSVALNGNVIVQPTPPSGPQSLPVE